VTGWFVSKIKVRSFVITRTVHRLLVSYQTCSQSLQTSFKVLSLVLLHTWLLPLIFNPSALPVLLLICWRYLPCCSGF